MPAYLLHIAAPPHLGPEEADYAAAQFAEVRRIVESFGGRYRTALRPFEILEGSVPGDRISLIEFGSPADLNAFYTSDEYRPHSSVREATIPGALLMFVSDVQ